VWSVVDPPVHARPTYRCCSHLCLVFLFPTLVGGSVTAMQQNGPPNPSIILHHDPFVLLHARPSPSAPPSASSFHAPPSSTAHRPPVLPPPPPIPQTKPLLRLVVRNPHLQTLTSTVGPATPPPRSAATSFSSNSRIRIDPSRQSERQVGHAIARPRVSTTKCDHASRGELP
jgi:hypothetical protein